MKRYPLRLVPIDILLRSSWVICVIHITIIILYNLCSLNFGLCLFPCAWDPNSHEFFVCIHRSFGCCEPTGHGLESLIFNPVFNMVCGKEEFHIRFGVTSGESTSVYFFLLHLSHFQSWVLLFALGFLGLNSLVTATTTILRATSCCAHIARRHPTG